MTTRPTHEAREGAAYAAPGGPGLSAALSRLSAVERAKALVAWPAGLLPGSIVPVGKDDIERALQPAVLHIDPHLLRRLLPTSHLRPGDNALCDHLLRCAGAPVPTLAFNAIGARKRCGRRYAVALPGGSDDFLLSFRQTDTFTHQGRKTSRQRGDRSKCIYLANIPGRIRPAFLAPPGCRFIDFDIGTAHHAIAAAISGDPALMAAVRTDLHAVTGELVAPHLPPAERRKVGKRCNSALLAGCSPQGLLEQLNKSGAPWTLDQAERALGAWWGRFPTLAQLVREVFAWVEELQESGHNLKLEGDGGRRLAYYDTLFIRGEIWRQDEDGVFYPGVANTKRPPRSVWTGVLRGIESLLMDRIFMEAHNLGLRLAMPLYDGALWVAPEDEAHALAEALKIAADRILREAGVPTEGKFEVRLTWG